MKKVNQEINWQPSGNNNYPDIINNYEKVFKKYGIWEEYQKRINSRIPHSFFDNLMVAKKLWEEKQTCII